MATKSKALTALPPPPSLSTEKKAISAIRLQSSDLVVADPDSRSNAVSVLSKIKALSKEMADRKADITRPINQALKAVRALFAPLEDDLEVAEKIIKRKLIDYETEVARLAYIEQSKVLAKLEAGKLKTETAEKKLAAIEQPVKVASGVAGGEIQFREVKVVKVVDESLVPREYLSVDMSKLKPAALAAFEKGETIAGVEVVKEKQIAAK